MTGLLSVFRRKKEVRDKIHTIRLTGEEDTTLQGLTKDLGFDNPRDTLVFGMDLLTKLKEWKDEGQTFFIGDTLRKKYMQVEIELYPNFGDTEKEKQD